MHRCGNERRRAGNRHERQSTLRRTLDAERSTGGGRVLRHGGDRVHGFPGGMWLTPVYRVRSLSWEFTLPRRPRDGPWDTTMQTRGGALLHYSKGKVDFSDPSKCRRGLDAEFGPVSVADRGMGARGKISKPVGVLLHCSKGRWTSVTPPSASGGLNGIHFTSAAEGWAVGGEESGGGGLFHYSNGTWTSGDSSFGRHRLDPQGGPFHIGDRGMGCGKRFRAQKGGCCFTIQAAHGLPYLPLRPGRTGAFKVFTSPRRPKDGLLDTIPQPRKRCCFTSPAAHGLQRLLRRSARAGAFRGLHFASATEGWAVGYDKAGSDGVLLHYSKGGVDLSDSSFGRQYVGPLCGSFYPRRPRDGLLGTIPKAREEWRCSTIRCGPKGSVRN